MANSGSVLLLLQFLLFQKFVYAAEMFSYFSSSKFINFSDKSVQKVAVVAYKDERSVKIFERLFEYVLGFEIKMVGGLVKNQQVDRLQQKFLSCTASHALLPTALSLFSGSLLRQT